MIELFKNSNFLVGIASGLVVSGLAYLFAILRGYIVKIKYNLIMETKILNIYDNYEMAKEMIYNDAVNSKKVYIYSSVEPVLLTMTGDFLKLLKEKRGDIRFLLVEPNASQHKKRGKELNLNSPSIKISSKSYIKAIEDYQKINPDIKYALHQEFIRTKFYIFDKVMYLGFRLQDVPSDKNYHYRIGEDSILYKTFLLQFEDSWDTWYSKSKTNVSM